MSVRLTGYGLAAFIFVLDQLTKWIIVGPVDLYNRRVVDVLPILELKWVENYGVSMGFLTVSSDTGRWLLVAMTGAIALGVAVWLWRETARADVLALACVLGGALGNIVDRVRFGYVVDFIGVHFGAWYPFLVFNVADAAITIGVLLLVLRALLTRDGRDRSENINA